MKFAIEGTALAGHIAPLEVRVLEHEGIDYDSISMAINKCDDRLYLDGKVGQPAYAVWMHINLSGAKADEKDLVGADPIDADAEASENGVSVVLKASDLKRANRIVGAGLGTYYIDENKKFIVKVGKTLLFEDAKFVNETIHIPLPVANAEERKMFNEFVADGFVDSMHLGNALDAAIRVSGVSGSKGELRSRAIHLQIDGNRMNVEAFTHNGMLIYPLECNFNGQSDKALHLPLHVAICTDAAKSLKLASLRSGKNMYWMYDVDEQDKDDEQIYFSSSIYSVRIDTEKVNECNIPSLVEKDAITLNVKKTDLFYAVYRVYVAGYNNLVLSWNDRKYISVCSPDKVVATTLEMDATGGLSKKTSMTVSTENLLKILGAFNGAADSFMLKYDFMDYHLEVHEDGDDIKGILFLV